MALRVLLADESTTIKRVIQLSLQDYAVNLQNVTIGPDVLQVALKFKPDLIFVDVLLPKRSGYDVCAELKSHPELASIPVVLIWSGFVELDKDRYQASQANGHLEKPFEINTLRNIVKNLVPKTKTQDLSQYLVFPDKPKEEAPAASEVLTAAEVQSLDGHVETASWGMEAFAPVEQFEEVQFPTPETPPAPPEEDNSADLDLLSNDEASDADAKWSHKKLERFRIDVPDEDDDDLIVEFEPQIDVGSQKEMTTKEASTPTERPNLSVAPQNAALQAVTPALIEKLIREQTKETLEQLILKVLPEIAEQVIQRELKKLIAERK